MNNYYKFVVFFALLFMSFESQATYCYSLGDGDFEDTANWSCGYVPGSGDTIEISAGDTVKVNNPITGLQGVWLKVYGCMDFKNAARVVFEYGDTAIPPSLITFFSGSSCINGNGSSGLSFGSGGSGCDVYRPASGTNPGIYPTIPGSYYDGCVWKSYLPINGLWTNVSILDNTDILFEWELKETNDIMAYEIIGGHGTSSETLVMFDARNNDRLEYYSQTIPLRNYDAFMVNAIHTDLSHHPLITYALDPSLMSTDIVVGPNPFDESLRVSFHDDIQVRIYSVEGQLIFEGTNTNSYIIDTKDFDLGFYYITISSGDQILSGQKLLKI